MDPALKQRLIGAAVLIALALIFLPMLLGRPTPAPDRGSDVPMEIPAAPDRPLQTREIPLTLPEPGQAAMDVATDVDAATDPAGSLSGPTDPDAIVTVDANAPPRVDALDPTAGEPTAPPAPAEDAAPAEADTTAPGTVAARSDRPARAPAPSLEDPPGSRAAPSAPVAAGHRYAVNLGSYAQPDNADALAAQLRQAGLPVLTEAITLEGKPATRVRVGPFSTRGDAEAARLAVARKNAALPTSVVQLTDAQSPQAQPKPATAAAFAVQVGALSNEGEANALRERLRRAGFAAFTERTVTDDGVLWRVRAGPELTRARAETLRANVKRTLALDGLVVSHP